MEFFNKKEEVLEVKLTNYGKDRLAAGQLNPTYYAFFDDDILYDVSGSGYTESQNDSEGRIQSDTPKIKIIPTREGAETRVNQFINQVSSAFNNTIGGHSSDPANNVEIFQQQSYGDKGNLNVYPLGRSVLTSQKMPAWKLELLSNSEITASQRYLDDDGHIQNIPQIDINIDYETYFNEGELSTDSITSHLSGTQIFLVLKENYLLLELLEENTDFEKQNFEIEVYQSSSSGYIQLSYAPESETEFLTPTVNNIEYFMNILVDNEIPAEVIQELNINDNALATNASRIKLNRDLYSTDNEEPC